MLFFGGRYIGMVQKSYNDRSGRWWVRVNDREYALGWMNYNKTNFQVTYPE